jgi:hypothetical protein
MITPPSRNDLATTFVHLHKADVPVKVVNVSTASTAGTAQRMKDLQTKEIWSGRCLQGAVDTAVSARSNGEYRPHESPANDHIIDDAGDAGGILPNVATEDRLSSRSQVSRVQPCFFKAVSNAVEAVTRVLDGPEGLTPSCGPQTGSYTHPCQPDRSSLTDPGAETPDYPSPVSAS